MLFHKFMSFETPKQAWDKLTRALLGLEKANKQQFINLGRDFENPKMKTLNYQAVFTQNYVIVNNIRLLGDEFSDKKDCGEGYYDSTGRYQLKI